MIQKYIKYILAIIAFPLILTSCEVFGLDYQDSYDYDYEAGMIDNHINMSTWEFIKSRSDLFSILQEGIEYAEISDLYKESNATYILPANKAFNSTTATDLSYFSEHKLIIEGEEVTPSSLIYYPKEQVKELLIYHIVKGKYTWSNLPPSPTWYETYASADTAKVNLYLSKDREPNIMFNKFDGHYKSADIKPRTSNLLSDEGAYIHVIESWLDRPTKQILGIK